MQREDTILSTIEATNDRQSLIWQGVSAALFILWVFTFAFFYFSTQLTTWQSLGVLKGELVSAVQQLSQQQQALAQRLQTLEQVKAKE
jgi:hypothetical protein